MGFFGHSRLWRDLVVDLPVNISFCTCVPSAVEISLTVIT